MKKSNILILLLVCFSAFQCKSVPPTLANPNADTVQTTGNLIIFYDVAVGKSALETAVKEYGATILYDYKNLNGIAIRIPQEKNIEEAIAYFESVRGVLSVNKDEVITLD
ncbi:MAG: hypothetical protein Q4G08_07960 [Capnocytophaga sp.]|nr:hypothetical protein [Capnocytophaga sp.]